MDRIALFLALAAASAAAHAQDTQPFTVSGEILPGACRVSFPDVDLGSHAATLFTGSYGTAYVDFSGTVSDCDPLVRRVAMSFDGSADPDNGQLFQGVQGVGLELVRVVSSLNVPIPPGGRTQYATAEGTYPYRARLLQSAAVVAAGRIQRPITVSLTYN
ncbi:fimbrial protein [Stenotrophomonas indicatrix]|jgi:type 1 fimbria pilin|uniref:fimbrial protein n=1 Tax=Stenotrophomonas indicatrix TaxID=2045451 RepID=UPI00289A7A3B|nr:fimbrial protein [Stenotrophomonas indicatrix]